MIDGDTVTVEDRDNEISIHMRFVIELESGREGFAHTSSALYCGRRMLT